MLPSLIIVVCLQMMTANLPSTPYCISNQTNHNTSKYQHGGPHSNSYQINTLIQNRILALAFRGMNFQSQLCIFFFTYVQPPETEPRTLWHSFLTEAITSMKLIMQSCKHLLKTILRSFYSRLPTVPAQKTTPCHFQ